MTQAELFSIADGDDLPQGFVYQADFISTADEQQLIAAIESLEFEEIRMHGVVAKRRTVQFGHRYGFDTFKLTAAPPLPEFLVPLRDRVAAFAGAAPDEFEEVLVTEYRAGAQIGWHRDAPPFDVIVGVSLLGECAMQFRPWPVVKAAAAGRKRRKAIAQPLAPRSVYVLRDSARSQWQHHIPPTKTLRYSITFRTLRRAAAGGDR